MKQELRIQMRFDGETQRKVDELRRLDPELPSRTDLIRRLIDEAYERATAKAKKK